MVSSVTDGDTAASGEAGDAFDIGFKLKHRLSDAKAQKEITQVRPEKYRSFEKVRFSIIFQKYLPRNDFQIMVLD